MAGSETKLVKACLDYLRVRGILAWRNNTGAVGGTYKGRRRFVRFGARGSGDIFAVLAGGRFLSVECKTGRNKPTADQLAWMESVKASGGTAVVVRSVDDLHDFIAGTM